MSQETHYERPSVTVDVVVIAGAARQPMVLLIKRSHPPFQGCWALPGGFVDPYEPLEAAARRELREETGVEPRHVEQLHTFGNPGRDPRGWTISVVHLALLTDDESAAVQPTAGDDAGEVGWFSLHTPPPLAFDHAKVLACAAHRLAAVTATSDPPPVAP